MSLDIDGIYYTSLDTDDYGDSNKDNGDSGETTNDEPEVEGVGRRPKAPSNREVSGEHLIYSTFCISR